MRHKIRVAAWTLLMIACGSGVVFSQRGSADPETRRQFFEDLQMTQGDFEGFSESLKPLYEDMQKNMQAKVMTEIMERIKDTSTPMTQEEAMKFGVEIALDGIVGLQKPINDKAMEFFSEEGRQKLHMRMFQMKESFMERLRATDNQDVIQGAFGIDTLFLMSGQPDFLELSPEQKNLILKQQKETSIELMLLTMQISMRTRTENQEKMAEMQRLSDAFGEAKTEEELEEINKKLQEINKDMYKDIVPEMKRLLIRGREDFYRALTDAQKAKIKVVMADMPDYMKKMFDDMDKGGEALSGLESWIPGMGAPGFANPNREAPRQRPQRERTFPGN
jgi:hypothetical protein